MRNLLIAICLFSVLGSCAKYPVEQAGGQEDVAYLLFVSMDKLAGQEVSVSVDGKTSFMANVIKQKNTRRKGVQYAIATGARSVVITYEGKVVYQKKLFLSSQEVKQIILP